MTTLDPPGQPTHARNLLEIDALCDEYETACRRHEHPDPAAFLARVAPDQALILLRELILLDVAYRQQEGEPIAATHYLDRFPNQRSSVEQALQEASRLRSLTLARPDSQAETILAFDSAQVAEAADLKSGLLAAGYQLEAELGRGGMGIVYRARQLALDRSVALKVVRSGELATEEERQRFQLEALAVASLDHPQIVPVFEVGRVGDSPFFSMKLIDGQPLDRLLQTYTPQPRPTAQVVAVLARAIHHAHTRGILHRDLKPANILIDHSGQPHITDFGLAKRLEGDQGLSATGSAVGTPSYMSPEQLDQSTRLTTATDVHGLGAILYAMLTGKAPFAGSSLIDTLNKVRQAVPEAPSRRNPRVVRDLETICLKALAKDPAGRYASALELALDLERYLAGEPIRARPAGAVERLVKWCRRRPALAAAFTLAALSFLGGFLGVAWKWHDAERERAKALFINNFLNQHLLAAASPERDPLAKNLTVRELLNRASAQLGGLVQGQPEVEADIRETLGAAYLALQQPDQARLHLTAALRLAQQLHGPQSRTCLRIHNLLGSLLDLEAKPNDAAAALAANQRDAQITLGLLDPITLDASLRQAEALLHAHQSPTASAILRQAVPNYRKTLGHDHPQTLKCVYLYSRTLLDLGHAQDALEFANDYAHHVQCSLGGNHPDNILAHLNLARIHQALGNPAQAQWHSRQAAAETKRIWGSRQPELPASTGTLTHQGDSPSP